MSESTRKEIEALGIGTVTGEVKGKIIGVEVPLDNLVSLAQKLVGLGYNHCSSMSAVDYPEENRFDLYYHVVSYETGQTVEIKTSVSPRGDVGNLPKVPSINDIYPQINWHEREHYDLMGIEFTGHPDLRRLLLPDEWGEEEGEPPHPLRRDYEQKPVPFTASAMEKEGFNAAKRSKKGKKSEKSKK
ncbi:MAG: NADH-quinone oxidoreductase subunit C [Candidatus Hodarchaeales archaeon]|jgi:NADH-quinone oxidoreductase subunit C